jgi:hypothetical protein
VAKPAPGGMTRQLRTAQRNRSKVKNKNILMIVRHGSARYCSAMSVFMRLVSLVLIVTALMLLGADAITSLERGGELTVRSLGTIWGLFSQPHLDGFKSWVQNHAPAMAQGVYSFLALPGWAATGVLGVILAFIFGRKTGPE